MIPNPFEASSVVWPLCFLLISLLVLKQVRDDVRPIFRGIIGGLAVRAQNNAVEWAMLLAVATLGSFQSLIDVAHANGWTFVESFSKVAAPFLAGIVAGARISPLTPPPTTVIVQKENTTPTP
jgi:hypothetical protein